MGGNKAGSYHFQHLEAASPEASVLIRKQLGCPEPQAGPGKPSLQLEPPPCSVRLTSLGLQRHTLLLARNSSGRKARARTGPSSTEAGLSNSRQKPTRLARQFTVNFGGTASPPAPSFACL